MNETYEEFKEMTAFSCAPTAEGQLSQACEAIAELQGKGEFRAVEILRSFSRLLADQQDNRVELILLSLLHCAEDNDTRVLDLIRGVLRYS